MTQQRRFTAAFKRKRFQWLAGQRGFKSWLTYSDAYFFSLSLKDTAIAKTPNEQRARSGLTSKNATARRQPSCF
jgi:hypothetical protein